MDGRSEPGSRRRQPGTDTGANRDPARGTSRSSPIGSPIAPAGRESRRRIVAAPFDDAGDPGRSFPFAVEGRQGAVQRSADRGWSGVRAAVTSDRGVSGETIAACFD
ncbi:MAG TPA: hypothetical protein VHM66_01810 [Solirubrobacterales bacterium]|nr:hypothetical protein [Solirubrobacterales bacterium]